MDESNGCEPTDIQSLSEEQRACIDSLSSGDISSIDAALLSQCDGHFRKVAFIVGSAMMRQPNRIDGVPDVFYGQRVHALVENGVLEAVGNLSYMRYSEVRRACLSAARE